VRTRKKASDGKDGTASGGRGNADANPATEAVNGANEAIETNEMKEPLAGIEAAAETGAVEGAEASAHAVNARRK